MWRRSRSIAAFVFFVVVAFSLPDVGWAQRRLPETVLPEDTLALLRDEVSGQRAFDLEVMLAGYNRIRTREEFEGYLYQAEYLHSYLKKFGFDELRIESLRKGENPAGWWVPFEAELSMVEPQRRKLARLEEDPALLTSPSDEVDVTAALLFLDKRDLPRLAEIDVKDKIILTPEAASVFAPAFEKGALGAISYYSHASPIDDPDQVCFDMRLNRGKASGKVFAMQISPRQGYELRDQILQGQRVVVHARTRVEKMPFKLDTVFAAIKGTAPEKKGLIFTAHLFERIVKQGANDNMSGTVVLAEVARALNALIAAGKIPRPERSIYFLWSEEGSGTMAFFKKYPEMVAKVLGAINMDMVGERLSANDAFFNVEAPPYSRPTFLDAVARNSAGFVAETNFVSHGTQLPRFAWPLMERRGSRDAFHFRARPYEGGSDHQAFNDSDSQVAALSFNVWPDHWYHTDKDLPDKSDPTQLKRVAFIGAASALATCGGDDAITARTVGTVYADRLQFVQEVLAKAVVDVSEIQAADDGSGFREAVSSLKTAFRVSQSVLTGMREITPSHPRASARLNAAIAGLEALLPAYVNQVQEQYVAAAKFAGIRPNTSLTPSPDEVALARQTVAKVKPLALGDNPPYSEIFGAFRNDPDLIAQVGNSAILEFVRMADGKTPLSDMRALLALEFGKPLAVKDLNRLVQVMTEGKLLQATGLAAPGTTKASSVRQTR